MRNPGTNPAGRIGANLAGNFALHLAACCLIMICRCIGQSVEYTPSPHDLKFTFGGSPPVMHVKPGSTISTWTEDCYYGAVKNPSDIPSKVAPVGKDNPQTGPSI